MTLIEALKTEKRIRPVDLSFNSGMWIDPGDIYPLNIMISFLKLDWEVEPDLKPRMLAYFALNVQYREMRALVLIPDTEKNTDSNLVRAPWLDEPDENDLSTLLGKGIL